MNERIIDRIAAFCGSLPFFYLNATWFAVWLIVNTLSALRFDPYPFSFLTLSVSLEAIFLSIFVLISQNQQAEADRQMEQRDCEINLKAEKEIRLLMEQQRQLREHMSEHSQSLALQNEMVKSMHALLFAMPIPRVRRKKDEVKQ